MPTPHSTQDGENERHNGLSVTSSPERSHSLPARFYANTQMPQRRATSYNHYFESLYTRTQLGFLAGLWQRAREFFSMQPQDLPPSPPSTLLLCFPPTPTCPSLCSDSVYSVASRPGDGALATRYFPLTNGGEPLSRRHFQVRDLVDALGHQVLGQLTVTTMHQADTIAAATQSNQRLRFAMDALAMSGLAGIEDAADVIRAEMAPPDLADDIIWWESAFHAPSFALLRHRG